MYLPVTRYTRMGGTAACAGAGTPASPLVFGRHASRKHHPMTFIALLAHSNLSRLEYASVICRLLSTVPASLSIEK